MDDTPRLKVKKIVTYTIVYNLNPDELSQKVTDFLSKGWQLSGSLTVREYGFYQAMIREEVEQP